MPKYLITVSIDCYASSESEALKTASTCVAYKDAFEANGLTGIDAKGFVLITEVKAEEQSKDV